jgi:hypothetical protein
LSSAYQGIIRKYGPAGPLIFQLSQELSGILATDSQDNLYVLSSETLFKFDPNGKPLLNFRVERPGSGPFSDLSSLAIDEHAIIYILDAGGRVYKFDKAGKYLTAWGNPSDGNNSPDKTKPGQLNYPIGLAADGKGHIYVGDFLGNHRSQKFDLNGRFLLAFGAAGNGNGQFGKYSYAGGLATDKAGNVYAIGYFWVLGCWYGLGELKFYQPVVTTIHQINIVLPVKRNPRRADFLAIRVSQVVPIS